MTIRGRIDSRRTTLGEERGAALVEFAVSAMLLFTLLFGIIEAGWALSNQLDLRHSAREGARVAAVGANNADIVNAVCDAIKPGPFRASATVAINGGTDVGDTVDVTVTATSNGLSGFLPVFNNIIMDDTAIIYLEQSPNFGAGGTCP